MQRQIWKSEEDTALLALVKQFKSDWNKISTQMSFMGFKRASKACRERYQNQLNPKISKRNWTQAEVQKLFVLQNQYGNKWTAIARQLPHRTDCIIKNYFYSLVRKVLRRLVKRVYGTKNSSFLTRSIKPCVLSRIFSANSKQDLLIENDKDFSKRFKDLILKYKDFKLVQQIEVNDQERIKQIFSALQNLNDNYNENKIMKKIAIKPIKKKIFSKLRLFQKRQLKINQKNSSLIKIQHRIEQKKPIFTLKNYKIQQKYTQKVFQNLIDYNLKLEQQYQSELEQYQQQFLLQQQQYYQQYQLFCQQSQMSFPNNQMNQGSLNFQQLMTQEQMMMQSLSPLMVKFKYYIGKSKPLFYVRELLVYLQCNEIILKLWLTLDRIVRRYQLILYSNISQIQIVQAMNLFVMFLGDFIAQFSKHQLELQIIFFFQMQIRQAWTIEDDQRLKCLYETTNLDWHQIAKNFQNRNHKQCKERYFQHIKSGLKQTKFTKTEINLLFTLLKQNKYKWVLIHSNQSNLVQRFKNRTILQIKNCFYTTIRRTLRRLFKAMGYKQTTQIVNMFKSKFLSEMYTTDRSIEALKLKQQFQRLIFKIKMMNVKQIQQENLEQIKDLLESVIKFNQGNNQQINNIQQSIMFKIQKREQIFKIINFETALYYSPEPERMDYLQDSVINYL